MRIGLRRRSHGRIHFRLTKAGWVFLGATAVVALTSVNSGLALLFVMFGCMLGALHVSAVLSRRMIAAVHVQRDLPASCRQNQRVHVGYLLRSARGGGTSLALRLKETGRNLEIPAACCGHLAAQGEYLSRTEMNPSRRGRVHLKAFRLSTTFPFGLVAASREFRQEGSLAVWPARGRLIGSLLHKGEADTASPAPSIRAGGQDEFYGLREYRAGDNARWIHWRRSAGRAEPVIREMSRPRPRTLWVVIDTSLPDSSPEARNLRERAIRFAGTLMEDALAAGYRVGAALAYANGSVVLAPADRRAQRQRLLDALADIDDRTTCRLPEVLGRLRQTWLRHAHVVVIGGSQAPRRLPADTLARLRRDCRSLSIVAGEHVADVFEDNPVFRHAEGEGCR